MDGWSETTTLRSLRSPSIDRKSTQVVEFGEFGDINVSFDKGMKFGNKPKCWVNVKKGDFPFTMPATFLAPSYTTAVSAAAGVVTALGISPKKITEWLTDFEGIPGRGELTRSGDGWLVRDHNPSVTPISIDWNIRTIEEHYANKDLGVVIEQAVPKAKTSLDLELIDQNLSTHSTVKGRYLLETKPSTVEPPASFEIVGDVNTAIRAHKLTYWCSNSNTD
jgi:coenzyme F430 synthetase